MDTPKGYSVSQCVVERSVCCDMSDGDEVGCQSGDHRGPAADHREVPGAGERDAGGDGRAAGQGREEGHGGHGPTGTGHDESPDTAQVLRHETDLSG